MTQPDSDTFADRRLRRCSGATCGYPHYWIDGDPAIGLMHRCPSDDPERFGYRLAVPSGDR